MMVTMTESTYDTLATEIAATAERLQRSTVQVRIGREGAGSGVIWQPDGLVITNAHVARHPAATIELWDGRVFEAEVTSRDQDRDLAALRFSANDLPAAPLGNSDELRVGQLVVAVGNPLGMVGALTLGIVHAIAPARGRRRRLVQADVRLAPGNSGGPLADVQGRVIGINAMVGGGLGLAIPSNDVTRFLADHGARPRLGVKLQPVQVPLAREQLPGLMVLDLEPGGAAEAGGLMVGDTLIGVNGQRFAEPRDLLIALNEVGPGATIHLDLVRGGVGIAIAVPLASSVDEKAQGAAA
jgi:serine protease Do